MPEPSPTRGPNGCFPPPGDLQPAVVVDHGPRTKKVVALTFDDGNNKANVRRILAFLIKNRVNATFFPTGRSIELAPVTWQMVADAAYPIGNHTYNHRSLGGLCYEAQLQELMRGVRTFQAQPLPLQPIMRPPYEAFDERTRLAASAAGASHVILWDVDTEDWTGIGREAIARRALAGRAGSIVLMHTSSWATSAALPTIVKWYRKRGFEFVTVQQLLGIPGPVPFN